VGSTLRASTECMRGTLAQYDNVSQEPPTIKIGYGRIPKHMAKKCCGTRRTLPILYTTIQAVASMGWCADSTEHRPTCGVEWYFLPGNATMGDLSTHILRTGSDRAWVKFKNSEDDPHLNCLSVRICCLDHGKFVGCR